MADFEIEPFTIFCDLNEDCIFNILEKISFKDLISAALTCRALKLIAERIFNKKYAQDRYDVSEFPNDVVRAFGAHIQNLTISTLRCGKQEITEVHQLCTNLYSLKINFVHFEVFAVPFLPEMFSNLFELDINIIDSQSNLQYSNYIEGVMRHCKQLRKLCVTGRQLEPFLHLAYPELREFSIEIDADYLSANLFGEFCRKNPYIKCLKLHCPDNNFNAFGVLELKYLESLVIAQNADGDFLDYNIMDIIQRLADFATLRSLEIAGKFNWLPGLCHLKQLTVLTLKLTAYERNLMDKMAVPVYGDFLRDMPNLKEFYLIHDGMNELTLDWLISVLQHCPKMEWLAISGFQQEVCKDYRCFDDEMDPDHVHRHFATACDVENVRYDIGDGCGYGGVLWWDLSKMDNLVNVIKNYLM